ncbi:MAG TPA: hypothetical protein VMI56_11415 [Reyranella sp.]|nr:hypothetical protein [Reyranella sp.]
MSNDTFADHRAEDGRFAKGNPGGPGRPRAPEPIASLDELVAAAGAELIEAALKEARGGNMRAIALLLARLWPARRGRPVLLDVPEIRSTADLLPVGAAMTTAVLNGEVTTEEGRAVASVLKMHCEMIEYVDLEKRMTELEEKVGIRPPA